MPLNTFGFFQDVVYKAQYTTAGASTWARLKTFPGGGWGKAKIKAKLSPAGAGSLG